jgi:hypothetical protein
MRPPIALLVYAPETPAHAVYYPLARFSPEWQALTYAQSHNILSRFIDLPQAIQFARQPEPEGPEGETSEAPADGESGQEPAQAAGAIAPLAPAPEEPAALTARPDQPDPRDDPLALLAEAAGYDDHELWWERQIEQRQESAGLFESILEAMTALREDAPPRDEREAQREAHMRQSIRAAIKDGYQNIAVVTGAWHSPALRNLDASGLAGADAALLKGLPRMKVEATWVPWTNSRLSYRNGYGAGVNAPGWYAHLWEQPDGAPARWLTLAAQTLRAEGLDVSSASVIEAVRLVSALAALRDLSMPGLDEMREATLTVLCNGDETRLALIRDKLEIGAAMGEVPDDAPSVPLARDLATQQRKLRFPPSQEIQKDVDFDLRKENDLAKSQLLHRLALLGVQWGQPSRNYRRVQGTFHEFWQIQWQVEFVVALIEASVWGNTIELAATAKAIDFADRADELPKLTSLLDSVMLAGLPAAITGVLDRVRAQAAATSDVRYLLDALPPLATIARYSDVRGSRAGEVRPVYAALFERALISLPNACLALDDDAAAATVESIGHGHESVTLLNDAGQRDEWVATLRTITARDTVHGLVRGRCLRLLLEMRALEEGELAQRARLALSPAAPAADAAAWIEGVVRGSALTLIQQDALWQALDIWLMEQTAESFVALLPALRRAFADFERTERQAMGRKVRNLSGLGVAGDADLATGSVSPVDEARAALVLPVLAQILGGGQRE